MGKTAFQAGKAARYASGDQETEQDSRAFSDGTTDVTFHTPAWHQARIADLMKPRPNYEEWKAKAKEAEGKLAAVADAEEARMQEYRAQLDADRAARMGKPGASSKDKDKDKAKKKKKKSKDKKSKKESSKDKKHKKDKSSKSSKKSSKDKKRRRDDSSDSSSGGSSSSSSDSEEEGEGKKRKRGEDDPVKLSEFMRG